MADKFSLDLKIRGIKKRSVVPLNQPALVLLGEPSSYYSGSYLSILSYQCVKRAPARLANYVVGDLGLGDLK